MAYNYYQTSMPGWGTSQFQFGAPPQPPFQPQPSWRGYDFYNAHAINPDPSLYDSIMTRLRDVLGMGVGHHEARHWHRRVYSGLVPLSELLPADIGAAAAYEAYRTWKYNSFLYEPLSADRERQREGLIGMAIAETQRLWQYSGRPLDTYGLRSACEASASAAHVLADKLFGWTSGGGIGGGYASSYSSSSADAYAYDDPYRHGRSRHNSFSAPTVVRVGAPPYNDPLASPYGMGGSPMPIPGAQPMPIPGTAGSYGAGMPGSYGATPGMAGSYTYGGASPNPYAAAAPAPYPGGMYPGAATAYPTAGYGVGQYGAPSAYGVPGAYGGGAYAAGGGGGVVLPNGQTVPPGSTVIISKPHRSRRHSSSSSGHHHHHHRHRSSSRSRYDDYDRDRYSGYEYSPRY
ncbi:hypothetical protein C8Q79DRAFT_1010443 [Trametes meyenii]|nr:hypothetical protein C8Q79DRAFT_1010443 [Trametes meyenii]